MGLHLHPGDIKQPRKRVRLSRHAWISILMLVLITILALCARSVSAQISRSEERFEKALALEPDISRLSEDKSIAASDPAVVGRSIAAW